MNNVTSFVKKLMAAVQGRTQIFKIHSRSMSVEKDIRWELLGRMCPNCTGTPSVLSTLSCSSYLFIYLFCSVLCLSET